MEKIQVKKTYDLSEPNIVPIAFFKLLCIYAFFNTDENLLAYLSYVANWACLFDH